MSAVTANTAPEALERYRAAFEARFTGAHALAERRRAALDQFLALGFPTPRDEDWKYTNLRRLETRSFAPALGLGLISAPSPEWLVGSRIVLLDGRWSAALSAPSAHPPGVTVLSLGQWAEREPDEVAALLAQHEAARTSAFDSLNLALFEDGVVVQLADGAQTDAPIYVVHQWGPQAQGAMSHPRILVRAGRNSRCTLIEQYLGPADAEYFTNAATYLDLQEGAHVEHYRLQQESARSFHIGAATARLAADSCYAMHDVALGASLGRTNVSALLQGSGARVALHGLIAPCGSQHLDAHTRIDHIAPQTSSTEDYRGVAEGRGRGVFNGKVIVRPGAQKTDARQSSRNLLLSPTAEFDSKPELEIYANDVKCGHGAVTGQLDAAALFYLRSRGVSEREARMLLIRAFAESVLTAIEHPPLKSYLERVLEPRFSLIESHP
ncbi:MAG TPA: Fe-S cluster assembly protein SufD [Steroidobacter sp.]|nr:Fe-S cluster assembly protein SufD [Steroidobacter sp.]